MGIIVWWQLSFKNFVPLTISTFETSNSCFHEIDVVYTWVNGSCPEFQKSLKKEMAKLGKNNLTVQGTMAARFYDWDTMKYSIRSVEMFAPCMRNLYIVTNGQSPDWLNLSNPKVTIVKHEDIFLNRSHLPTFNSNAIEHHLHQINGLSEKFLYFNDDVFLSNNISQHDLYYGRNGQQIYTDFKVKQCFVGCEIDGTSNGKCNMACNNSFCHYDGNDCLGKKEDISLESPLVRSYGAWLDSLSFCNGMLSEKFGVLKRYYISHVPQFLDRDIMAIYTKTFARYIEKTSSSKFRTKSDVPMAFAYYNFLMSQRERLNGTCGDECKYSFNIRNGYSGYLRNVGVNRNPTQVKARLESWLKSVTPFSFVQDGNGPSVTPDENTESHKVLREYLEKKFPLASQFELAT